MDGWIKISRRLREWEWIDVPEMVSLWVNILLMANYEDKKWRGILVKRGSFITTRSRLSEETGISERTIRTGLQRLETTGEISIKVTNKYTIVTVCKYDDYQEQNLTSDQQLTNKRPTTDQQLTTTKEIKNNNKETISKDIAKKVTLDFSFVHAELQPLFQEFIDMRKKIGKPLKTQKGVNERYKKLIELSGGNLSLAIRIINQSLAKEWQDFYSIKDEPIMTGKTQSKSEAITRIFNKINNGEI